MSIIENTLPVAETLNQGDKVRIVDVNGDSKQVDAGLLGNVPYFTIRRDGEGYHLMQSYEELKKAAMDGEQSSYSENPKIPYAICFIRRLGVPDDIPFSVDVYGVCTLEYFEQEDEVHISIPPTFADIHDEPWYIYGEFIIGRDTTGYDGNRYDNSNIKYIQIPISLIGN